MKTIKLLIGVSFFIFHFSLCEGQSWMWGRQGKVLGGNGAGGEGYNSVIDKNNNVYIAGQFADTLIFNKDTLYGGEGGCTYIAKYDPNGTLLWVFQPRGARVNYGAVATDKAGNVYLGGNFYGNMQIGTYNLSNSIYSCNIFLSKLSQNGNVIWAKQGNICSPSNTAECYSISCDNAANIYITGYFKDTLVFDKDTLFTKYNIYNEGDVFIAKFDSSGKFIWAKQSQVPSVWSGGEAYSLSVDSKCNIYVTGKFIDTISFGSLTLRSLKYFDGNIFLTKYDSSGNVIWAKQSLTKDSSSITTCNSYFVTTDGSENCYITGTFGDTTSFGSKKLFHPTNGNYNTNDFFIVKYDKKGNVLWAKEGEYNDTLFFGGYSLCTDNANNLYFTGGAITYGNRDYKISFGLDTLSILTSSEDPCILVKFDSLGNYICGTIMISGGDDYSNVVLDPTGNYIYFSGDFISTIIFGPDTLHGSLNDYGGQTEIPFVARWQLCGSTEDITPIKSFNPFISLFPNPNNGKFTIQLVETGHALSVNVEVYNVMGEKVYSHYQIIKSSNYQIDLSSQPNGIYFYRVLKEDGALVGSGKVIIEH